MFKKNGQGITKPIQIDSLDLDFKKSGLTLELDLPYIRLKLYFNLTETWFRLDFDIT